MSTKKTKQNNCPQCEQPTYILSIFGSICSNCLYDPNKDELSVPNKEVVSTQPTLSKCCEKCNGIIRDESSFGRDYGCLKDDCECHKPFILPSVFETQEKECECKLKPCKHDNMTPLPKEDWTIEFDSNFHIGGEMIGKPEELKSFIQSQIEAEREKAFKEGYDEATKKWVGFNGTENDKSYQYGVECGRVEERERIVKMIEKEWSKNPYSQNGFICSSCSSQDFVCKNCSFNLFKNLLANLTSNE